MYSIHLINFVRVVLENSKLCYYINVTSNFIEIETVERPTKSQMYLTQFTLYFILVGELRDFTGSYLSSFYYMGVSAVIASIILLMEPLGRKMLKKSKDADITEKQNMLNLTEKQ